MSKDFPLHLKTLEEVLDRLNTSGLNVNLDECQFCRTQLKYLGYVVDRHGLHPDIEKITAILEILIYKDPKKICRFVGTASWYRRLIPNFSSILAPLTALTKKNVK